MGNAALDARSRFTGTHKQCTICNRWKPIGDFWKDKTGLGGVTARCGECLRLRWRVRRRKNPEVSFREERQRDYTDTHKRCRKCRNWKTHDKYHADKSCLGGIRARCKECCYAADTERINAMSSEEYEAYAKIQADGKQRRRDRRQAKLRKDIRDCLKELRKQGLSDKDICSVSGIHRRTLARMDAEGGSYVLTETHLKIRDALDLVMTGGKEE